MRYVFKTLLLPTLIVAVCMTSSNAHAVAGKVAGGKHDFSSAGTSSQYKASVGVLGSQVCIYCHTPHNAGQTRLLWNKAANGNVNFRLYTSSESLSETTKKHSSLDANSPSLLCLSCHDGKTAMNVLHAGGQGNTANGSLANIGPPLSGYPSTSKLAFGTTGKVMTNVYDILTETWTGAALGGPTGDDLTNDHPIGFSYTGAQTDLGDAKLHSETLVNTNSANRIRFFGSTKKVECSTCHDPHIENTLSVNPNQIPFLVMANDGSKLCLACHNK